MTSPNFFQNVDVQKRLRTFQNNLESISTPPTPNVVEPLKSFTKLALEKPELLDAHCRVNIGAEKSEIAMNS